ncbi:MAG: hypothetical protein EBV06_12865 [Planctomycetia bacterium]|nr:hypothetical protein [Planctomycetia bacterium]
MNRLEDLIKDWRSFNESLIDETLTNIGILIDSGSRSTSGHSDNERIRDTISTTQTAAFEWVEKKLTSSCLDWLQGQGHWPNPIPKDSFIRQELIAALQHLPSFDPQIPEPTLEMPLRSWTIAAGVGSLVGMLPGVLLGWMLTGQRETGLVIGGIGGAAGMVLTVGLLAQAPLVRSALTYALALGATGSLLGGVLAFWRQQSTTGWFRSALALLAAWFVVVVAKPVVSRPEQDIVVKQIKTQLRFYLKYVADLVLCWCWAHPQRQPDRSTSPLPAPTPLSGSISRCLGDLRFRLRLADGVDGNSLKDAVEILIQRFEDAGYEWKDHPPGTVYADSMRSEFETFGRFTIGQQIRTRRPALYFNGQLIQKGELQRDDRSN